MGSSNVRIINGEEVYFSSRAGPIVGCIMGGGFVAIGLFVIEDAPLFFRIPWTGFSALVFCLCAWGLIRHPRWLTLGADGIKVGSGKMPVIPWHEIVSVELGAREQQSIGGKRRYTTEAGRPILLKIRNAETYRAQMGALGRFNLSASAGDGSAVLRVDGSSAPVPTIDVIDRIRYYGGAAGLDASSVENTPPVKPMSRSARRAALAFALIWTVLFAGGGAAAFWSGVGPAIEGMKSSRWPEVEASVKNAYVTSDGERKERRFVPTIAYVFQLDGKERAGRRYQFGRGYENGKEAWRIAKEHPPGMRIRIRYNPDNPDESVIRPGFGRVEMKTTLVGAVFVVIGLSAGGLMIHRFRSTQQFESDIEPD